MLTRVLQWHIKTTILGYVFSETDQGKERGVRKGKKYFISSYISNFLRILARRPTTKINCWFAKASVRHGLTEYSSLAFHLYISHRLLLL